jgi:hypothetical protein
MTHLLPKIYQTNSHPFTSGYRTTKIKETANGYKINRFSNYISLQNITLTYQPNGFSKAIVKVDTNYRPKYQYTLYFDNTGELIKSPTDNDKEEKKIWLAMQK